MQYYKEIIILSYFKDKWYKINKYYYNCMIISNKNILIIAYYGMQYY